MSLFGRLLRSAAIAAVALSAPALAETPVVTRFVTGGGGLPIAMSEWGPANGRAIVLLHGAGFSKEYWTPQQRDPKLADRYHFVSIDLRGHGASGKPWLVPDFANTALWAADVQAAIDAAHLDHPVIVGWSMGGYIALDYIRRYGADAISGLMLVSSTGGLVPTLAPKTPRPGYKEAAADLGSPDLARFARGAEEILPFMTATTLDAAQTRAWADEELSSPLSSRQAMRGFRIDNADLAPSIRMRTLFVIGAHDAAMPADALAKLSKQLPQASLTIVPTAGHTVSFDDTAGFDAMLATFVDTPPR